MSSDIQPNQPWQPSSNPLIQMFTEAAGKMSDVGGRLYLHIDAKGDLNLTSKKSLETDVDKLKEFVNSKFNELNEKDKKELKEEFDNYLSNYYGRIKKESKWGSPVFKTPDVMLEIAGFNPVRGLRGAARVSKDFYDTANSSTFFLENSNRGNRVKDMHLTGKQAIKLAILTEDLALTQDLANLEMIDLSFCDDIEDADMQLLAEHCPHLKVINLSDCIKITDEALRHLSTLNLTSLRLDNCRRISDKGLAYLTSIGLAYLISSSSSPAFDQAYLEDLSSSNVPAFPLSSLQLLSLEGCVHISNTGLACLKPLTQLTSLNLRFCGINSHGLRFLLSFSQLTSLKLFSMERISNPSTTDEEETEAVSTPEEGVLVIRHLSNLVDLSLTHSEITDTELTTLITSLINLKHLDVQHCLVITDEGLVGLNNLTSLNLMGTHVTNNGLQDLSNQTPLLIESLVLSHNVVQNEDDDLSCLTKWKLLTSLELSGHLFNDNNITSLDLLNQLQSLKIQFSKNITNTSLLNLKNLINLTEFVFNDTNIDGAGLKDLACFTLLQKLDLDSVGVILDDALGDLAPLTRLTELNLSGAAITGEGLGKLVNHLPLKHLVIQSRPLYTIFNDDSIYSKALRDLYSKVLPNDEGLRHIAGFKQLQNVTLTSNQITDALIPYLEKLKDLEFLTLHDTKMTLAALSDFKKSRPWITIMDDKRLISPSE